MTIWHQRPHFQLLWFPTQRNLVHSQGNFSFNFGQISLSALVTESYNWKALLSLYNIKYPKENGPASTESIKSDIWNIKGNAYPGSPHFLWIFFRRGNNTIFTLENSHCCPSQSYLLALFCQPHWQAQVQDLRFSLNELWSLLLWLIWGIGVQAAEYNFGHPTKNTALRPQKKRQKEKQIRRTSWQKYLLARSLSHTVSHENSYQCVSPLFGGDLG